MEQNAYTVASHLTLIAILVLLAVRVLRAPYGTLLETAMDLGFKATVAIGCVALVLERSYYVAARFLMSDGFDLWQMHPAPEVLSVIVALGLYAVMIPVILARAAGPRTAALRITVELSCAAGFWVAIAWVLY
ncbi:hypothetical protein [Roseobacter sp. S98]|uniref:hypothetical protein n=1 Tax=Roseobacter algicola (ex Choi et al. 2025) (nom. illeg.) TaxID=3092138 RepID=UPI003F510B57